MKKTLITLLALAGVASAAPVVVTFGNETAPERDFITDSFFVSNVGETTYELQNGATVTLTPSQGNLWAGSTDGSVEKTWGNAAAITAMNTALGLTDTNGFTADDFSTGSGIYYTATGNGGSSSTLTLNLGETAKVGDTITLFVTAASRQQHTAGFSITGLGDDITLSYAGLNGNGFTAASGSSVSYSGDLAANWSPNTESVQIFQVTGTLASTTLTMSQPGTAKNGWQTLSYVVTPAVPEPTTATLSLLALAGLAARRRRR